MMETVAVHNNLPDPPPANVPAERVIDFEIAPGAEICFRGGLVGVVDGLPLVWECAPPGRRLAK